MKLPRHEIIPSPSWMVAKLSSRVLTLLSGKKKKNKKKWKNEAVFL